MDVRTFTRGSALAAAAATVVACSGPVKPDTSTNTPKPSTTSIVPTPLPTTTPTTVATVPQYPPATLPGSPTTTPPIGTTGIPGQCSLQSGNPTCDACAQQACCTQILQCESNQDCVAEDACEAQCIAGSGGNPQLSDMCAQQCAAAHPMGMQLLQALYQCLGTTCQAQCPF